jgi:hypothetical protein
MDYADNPVNFTIGGRNLALRFTSSAYEIMGSIVALDPSQIIPEVLRVLGPINQIRNTYLSDPLNSQIVTLDGVALFERDLLQSTRS